MKGLTFYRLISPFKEDKTKNCGLLGEDLDTNFFNLKCDSIKTAYWENDVFVLERASGEIIAVSGITKGCTKDLDIKYDKEEGALIVTMNGTTTLITGFTRQEDQKIHIYSDNSLNGKGTIENPLSISPLAKTGQYKPAIKVVDTTRNENLPDCKTLAVGDRFVTVENISDFGYLYDYNSVSKISTDLRESCSPWRVPTKEDWDNMLNAVEPRPEDRNHDKVTSNKYLGRFAGKLLKSINFWRLESSNSDCNNEYNCCENHCNNDCYPKATNHNVGCEEKDPYCSPTCGEHKNGCGCNRPNPYPNRGIDKYGFSAVPAGYGDDGDKIAYFGERGWYWTATNSQCLNAYTKRFEYDKSSVFQEIIGVNNLLSLRLIKDYDGSNYNERESILGSDYSTALMPSKNGQTIWTTTNIAFSNRYYNPTAPNNGIGLTFTKKFFINEWNGKRWLKNELRDGESIIFKKAPNGGDNIEYRVINGVLANVAEAIYDDVIITLRPELDSIKGMISAEIVRAKEAERQLQYNLDGEIARAVFAEKQLQEQIDNLDSNYNELDEKIDSKFNELDEKIDSNYNELNEKIDSVIGGVDEKFEVLDTKIELEIARATEAEQVLDAKIDVNTKLIQDETDRAIESEMVLEGKIEGLRTDLDAEIERSIKKDEEIEAKLDAEIDHVTNIEAKLDAEIERSINKDNEIEGVLNAEIERSIEQDKLITEKLLQKDGHKFSASEGVLDLKTNTPENNITINLDFNFGTI